MNKTNSRIFAVVSEPRTGSTVISNKFCLLDGVHCQGEIFHSDKIYCSVSKDSIPNIQERNEEPVNFLNEMIEQTYEQKNQPDLIGFKLFFDHNLTITDYLIKNKIPIILLERTNKLAQYSSLKIAKKTGQWHSKQKLSNEQQEINRKQGKKIKFSLLEFIAFSIRSRYRFHQLIKALKKNSSPYHYVKYEDIFDPTEWQKIVKFLKLELEDIEANETLVKQNKGSLLNRFSNTKYVYYCCRVILLLPFVANFLNITSSILLSERES